MNLSVSVSDGKGVMERSAMIRERGLMERMIIFIISAELQLPRIPWTF